MLLKDYPSHSDKYLATDEAAYLGQLLPLLSLAITPHPSTPISPGCGDLAISLDELRGCAESRVDSYKDHLESIGITSMEFVQLYLDIANGDTAAMSQTISHTETKMGKKPNTTTNLEQKKTFEPSSRHLEIIQKLLDQGRDNIFEYSDGEKIYPAKTQEIVIIAGPIASGKTEIYEKLYRDTGYVVIDLDIVRQMLTDTDNPDQKTVDSIRTETWHVSDLLLKMALEQGKSVVMQSPMHRIDRWKIDPNMIFAREKAIPIKIHMVLRPILDCLIRNLSRTRSAAIGDLVASMAGMELIYEFINTFKNITEVNFVDFYPYVKSNTGFLPVMYQTAYEKIHRLIKSKPGSCRPTINIYIRRSDLAVENESL